MSYAAEALTEFHEFFGLDRPELGLSLRQTLIEEEYEELVTELEYASELDAFDLKRAYKELADLVYVIYGLDLHIGGHLDQVLEAVHKSNMTKLWPCPECFGSGCGLDAEQHADEDWTTQEPVCDCCSTCNGTGKSIKRRPDGKVLKPPTYQPPDLSFVKEVV